EAIGFYARPARRAQPVPAPELTQTTALAPSQAAAPLLDRALSLVSPDAYARVEEGVLYAANAALGANGVAADDLLSARATLQDARSLLSLGLDVLAEGDPARAAAILTARAIRDVFQAGMGELYGLQGRARRAAAAARLPTAKSATLLELPYSEL